MEIGTSLLDKENEDRDINDMNLSDERDSGPNQKQIYFWEKWAYKPDDKKMDKPNFYKVDENPKIREVIRNLESKIIDKKLLFSDIEPKNSSVKKWINEIRQKYPRKNEDLVEYLLDTFRESLYPRSKEKHKVVVGLLLLHNVLLILHCKKDPSLAEFEEKIYPVKLILHPKNVLRAAIIRNEEGKTTFSAFEYSRKWSKGHAEFWDIEPEDVSWEKLGSLSLKAELNSFPYPVELPIDSEQLDEMVSNNRISPTGKIKIGREEGKITSVDVFRRTMDFAEFYDFYITEQEKLEEHRKKFKELVFEGSLEDFDKGRVEKYRYKDCVKKLYEISPDGDELIQKKEHPRYTLCFFTKTHPGIKPTPKFVNTLYQSIFENVPIEIWHAGDKTSTDPTSIGALEIYNKLDIDIKMEEFSNNLLNIIQDAASKKTGVLLKKSFCDFWRNNLDSQHLSSMFDFIGDLISREIKFEFSNDGIFDKEGHLEFKSADSIKAKPSEFVNVVLIPTISKYTKNDEITRYCILYGIEDNGDIKSINNLKNDQVEAIEGLANKNLLGKKIKTIVHPIPFHDGFVMAVFIIPLLRDKKTQ